MVNDFSDGRRENCPFIDCAMQILFEWRLEWDLRVDKKTSESLQWMKKRLYSTYVLNAFAFSSTASENYQVRSVVSETSQPVTQSQESFLILLENWFFPLSLSYSLTRRQCFPIQPTSHNPCVLRFDLKLKPIALYYERVPTFSDSGLQDTLHDQSAYTSVPKIKFSDLTYNPKDTSVRRWKWNDLWTLQVLRGRPKRGRFSSLLSLLPTAFLYNRQDRRTRNL